MAICMGLLMVMQWVFPPPKRAPKPAQPAGVTQPAATGPDVAAAQPGAVAPAQPGTMEPGTAQPQAEIVLPETTHVLGGKPLAVTVSSHGARVVAAKLPGFVEHRQHKDGEKTPVDVGGEAGPEGGMLTLWVDNVPQDASYKVVEEANGVVRMEREGSGYLIQRSYSLKEGHGVQHTTTITNKGTAARLVAPAISLSSHIHPAEREGGGFLSGGVPTDQTSLLCETPETQMREIAPSLKDPVVLEGKVAWFGVDRQYFLSGAVFRDNLPARCEGSVAKDTARMVARWAPVTLQPGESVTLKADAFFGPKQEALLTPVDPQLANAIDYGWFGALVRLLLRLLVWFYSIIPNYGVAILLLTLTVKLLTLPLTQRSFVSQQRMKDLQPRLKEIQAKYAHDKAMQGQKQMELFKQENVSPLGGCLPMLVQMPIWIALYRTLYTAVELYQQPFLAGWIEDLTQKDPFYITPIALGAVMLVQAFLTPTPQDQPQMKYVQYGMPIFFTTIMVALPSGLTIYMFFNTVLTIVQQLYIKRRFGAPAGAAEASARA